MILWMFDNKECFSNPTYNKEIWPPTSKKQTFQSCFDTSTKIFVKSILLACNILWNKLEHSIRIYSIHFHWSNVWIWLWNRKHMMSIILFRWDECSKIDIEGGLENVGFGVKCQNNISSIDSKTKPRVRQKRRSEQFNKVNLTRCRNRYNNDFTSRLGKDQIWRFVIEITVQKSTFALFRSELFDEFKFLDSNALFCFMPCLCLQKYFIWGLQLRHSPTKIEIRKVFYCLKFQMLQFSHWWIPVLYHIMHFNSDKEQVNSIPLPARGFK